MERSTVQAKQRGCLIEGKAGAFTGAEPCPGKPAPLPTTLDPMAVTAMREALEAPKGNVSLAARRLGVSRSTLYRRFQGNA